MTNVRRAAFDTETVSPAVHEDEYPDCTDYRDFELTGAAIAYEYAADSKTPSWSGARGGDREVNST